MEEFLKDGEMNFIEANDIELKKWNYSEYQARKAACNDENSCRRKIFFFPTPATFIIIIVFFVAALFSQVLSFVFQDAINYKEENGLTI